MPAKTGLFDAYWIVNVQPEGDHEFVAMELCSNRAMLPQLLKGEPLELGKMHAFTVKQPESPVLDRPEVRAVKVEANGKQVAVSWEIPRRSSRPTPTMRSIDARTPPRRLLSAKACAFPHISSSCVRLAIPTPRSSAKESATPKLFALPSSKPSQPGRVSISIAWAHNWRWQPLTGDLPARGLRANRSVGNSTADISDAV